MVIKYILLFIFFFQVGIAQADSNWKLIANGWTYHYDRSSYWNEQNSVFGFEYKINENTATECVRFLNSFFQDSFLCGFIIKYNHENEKYTSLKFGFVDGYLDRVLPYILPTYGFIFDKTTIELGVTPVATILILKVNF